MKNGTQPLIKRLSRAFIIAAAGSLGTLAVQLSSNWVQETIFPFPFASLKGDYKGHWEWTDPKDNSKQSTDDSVFFDSINGNQLSGHGSDSTHGEYKFSGFLKGTHVSAIYENLPGSAQPVQSGAFELNVTQRSPLVLEGTWTGFKDGALLLNGTAQLKK